MKKLAKQKDRRKRRRLSRLFKWIGVAGAVVLALYAISRMSGVAYTDDDIRVVNFSALDAKEKHSALEAANHARCTCGCGMTLAQCVATDSTCPIRERNIERIELMVKEAKSASHN